jgi:serine/threonine-protein kinase
MQIGRYQVQGEVGRGAMGIVYRAHDPLIGRTVAIKTIQLKELAGEAERGRLRERLRREAQSAGILSHPNIVTIYDIQEQGDTAYIFMEFVEGPTLDRLLEKGELPGQAKLVNVFKQIASALDYAHSKGIVHRDIKPANIMLHDLRIAKVTDFGVARINTHPSSGTITGSVLGTPNYMSPEQIQGQSVDGRTDQFAFAVTVYELLTGEKPYAGESLATVIYKIVNQPAQAPHHINATLPAELARVFDRAMHKNRDHRYPSCTEFVEDLERVLELKPDWKPLARGAAEDLPTTVIETVPPRPAFAGPTRSVTETQETRGTRSTSWMRWMLAPLGVALAAAIGVYVWYAMQPPPAIREGPPPVAANDADKPSAAGERIPAPPEPASETKAEEPKPDPPKPAPPKPETPKPEQTDPAPRLVELTIDSIPPDAQVTLDSGRGCRTPCTISVPGGRTGVTVGRPGYRTEFRNIDAAASPRLTIPLTRLEGTLYVSSNPPGATIKVDGQAWPARTPTSLTLAAGKHRLEFTREGMPPQSHEVDIREGAVANLEIRWSLQ